KLVLLWPLAGSSLGIGAATITPLLGSSLLLVVLLPRLVPGYDRRVTVDRDARALFQFSLRSFPGSLLAGAPQFLLPVLVLAVRGPRENAWFYVAWSISFILFLLPAVVSQLVISE